MKQVQLFSSWIGQDPWIQIQSLQHHLWTKD